MAKPFLRWVGGKQKILPELLKRVPNNFDDYIEPFLGGGSMFFALHSKGRVSKAYLSDSNKHLIEMYRAVKEDHHRVSSKLQTHKELFHRSKGEKGKEYYYYWERAQHNKDSSSCVYTRAATNLFLNRTCYNGLYRENSEGKFNTPYGHLKKPHFPDLWDLWECSKALKVAYLENREYNEGCPFVSGDFVYLDPPYLGTYSYGHRIDYDFFKRLREYCFIIGYYGAKFMLTHHDHPDIRNLFAGGNIEEITGSTCVSGLPKGRGKRMELIIRNYETTN